MSTRKVVTASVAVFALAVMPVPIAGAQDDAPTSGSLPAGGLFGGSVQDGSLADASVGGSGGEEEGEEDPVEGGSGSAGDLGSTDSEGGGLSGLVPERDEICELPGLGGSVAKFYPLFGITGVPTGVIDIVTSALDSFPNLLDVVAGEGAGPALLWETGSLSDGLCTSIFGGEMVALPETVYVDEDGNPVSTATSTPAPGAGSSGSDGPATSGSSGTSDVTSSEEGAEVSDTEEGAAKKVLTTTVPVP